MWRNKFCDTEEQQVIIKKLISSVEVIFGKMISDPGIQEELEKTLKKRPHISRYFR